MVPTHTRHLLIILAIVKESLTIGTGQDADIQIWARIPNADYAELRYVKGEWMLYPLLEDAHFKINKEHVIDSAILSKYDIIQIENERIHWADYYYEGDDQNLSWKDMISYHGRISRANFRALSILILGLYLIIPFVPSLLISLTKRRGRPTNYELIESLYPPVIAIGYGLLTCFLILLIIKRCRDAKVPFWHMLIPFYNLKVLFGYQSK